MVSGINKWKSVRSQSELPLLPGVEIALQQFDGSNRAVEIIVGGQVLRVEADYGIRVLVPAPPEMKKVWRLSGAVLGIPVQEDFEHEYEAQARQREIEDGSLGVSADRKALKIEEIEVPVPDED